MIASASLDGSWWCGSSGFDVERVGAWPPKAPARAMLRLSPVEGPPEYERISYERPLRCSVSGLIA